VYYWDKGLAFYRLLFIKSIIYQTKKTIFGETTNPFLIMKKFLLLTVSALLIQLAYATTAKLSGKITNPTSDWVYVYKQEVKDGRMRNELIDSAKLNEGKFSMTIPVKNTGIFMFYDKNERFLILLSPDDDIHLALNTAFFDETIEFTGKGSEKNRAIKNVALAEEIIELQAELTKGANIMELDTTAYFKEIDEAFDELAQLLISYEKEIPDFKVFSEQKLAEVESSKKSIRSMIAMDIAFEKLKTETKGKTMVNVVGKGLDGKKVDLYAHKGKPVLVDFWATWCGPCRAEMPHLKELEEAYKGKIEVVSVAAWCEEEGWKKMAKDYGFENNIYLPRGEEGDAYTDYMIQFIPRYILLDKDLNIVDVHAPRPSSGQLNAMIDKLLSN
jgi:thiol-disulfide isomerase/thioredoxin